MTTRNITPADERIDLAVAYLEGAARKLKNMRRNIPGIADACNNVTADIDSAIDMLHNGYVTPGIRGGQL